jgi:hypothetical protein
MTQPTHSYIAPTLEAQALPQKGGHGLFAHHFTPAGTVLLVWGGSIVDGHHLAEVPPDNQPYSVQIEEDLYLVTLGEPEPADYINHSCDPNAGLCGQIVVVALRDVEPGEEICFDYAMSDGSPYDEFTCACGAPNCRGRVTGNDWMLPELQARYAGHFMPYLQRRIDRLQQGNP